MLLLCILHHLHLHLRLRLLLTELLHVLLLCMQLRQLHLLLLLLLHLLKLLLLLHLLLLPIHVSYFCLLQLLHEWVLAIPAHRGPPVTSAHVTTGCGFGPCTSPKDAPRQR